MIQHQFSGTVGVMAINGFEHLIMLVIAARGYLWSIIQKTLATFIVVSSRKVFVSGRLPAKCAILMRNQPDSRTMAGCSVCPREASSSATTAPRVAKAAASRLEIRQRTFADSSNRPASKTSMICLGVGLAMNALRLGTITTVPSLESKVSTLRTCVRLVVYSAAIGSSTSLLPGGRLCPSTACPIRLKMALLKTTPCSRWDTASGRVGIRRGGCIIQSHMQTLRQLRSSS